MSADVRTTLCEMDIHTNGLHADQMPTLVEAKDGYGRNCGQTCGLNLSRTEQHSRQAPIHSRSGRISDSFEACACGRALPTVRGSRDNCRQETTNASRPQTNGAGTPVRGLADRLETTDS